MTLNLVAFLFFSPKAKDYIMKTVCVIGAGVSGLVATKTCLEEGLDVVCLERSHDVGKNLPCESRPEVEDQKFR